MKITFGKCLVIIVALITVITAFYRFDYCKVNEAVYAEDMAEVSVQLLEIQRRNLQQRIWDFQKAHVNYQALREYKKLIQDLKLLDMKIAAKYRGKG